MISINNIFNFLMKAYVKHLKSVFTFLMVRIMSAVNLAAFGPPCLLIGLHVSMDRWRIARGGSAAARSRRRVGRDACRYRSVSVSADAVYKRAADEPHQVPAGVAPELPRGGGPRADKNTCADVDTSSCVDRATFRERSDEPTRSLSPGAPTLVRRRGDHNSISEPFSWNKSNEMEKSAGTMAWEYAVFVLFVCATTAGPLWRRRRRPDEKAGAGAAAGDAERSRKREYVFAGGVSTMAMLLSVSRGTLGVRSFLGE